MPKLNWPFFKDITMFSLRNPLSTGEYSSVLCRIFFMSVILTLLLCASSVADTEPVIDYRLDIQLQPDSHRLDGIATLDFHDTRLPASLRLTRQADVLSVESSGRPLPFTFQNGRLALPESSADKISQLTIRYRAVFDDPPPIDTVGIEDPSFGVTATIRHAGTYLSAGTAWFPLADDRRGRHRVKVTAPAEMIGVTAGRFLGSHKDGAVTVSEWDNEFPLDGLALAVGYYQVATADLDGIQLLTFLSAENADLAPIYLAAMRRHLSFYRGLLGPYPFSKFAVVENFLPTGYGMPSWTLLGRSVVRLPFLPDTSLPHEIVHSWWGNAVEVDYTRGNWAEGLTTYLADYLLKERSDPQEAREYRRKLMRDYAALVTPESDFPLTGFTGRSSKTEQAIGYGKAAMVFHLLRQEVGEQAFHDALRSMAVEGNGGRLGWREIEAIFARESGRDLRWFFAQWVERRGAPVLTLEDLRTIRKAKGWIVSGIVRQTGESYRLDLPLRLKMTNGETIEQKIRLKGSRTPFSFALTAEPQRIDADPASDIFRRLQPEELPATVNDLLQSRQPLVVVASGHDNLLLAAENLLKGLHWSNAQVVGETSVAATMLTGRDVLLIGWPTRKALRPALPAGLTVSDEATANWRFADGSQESDVLFTVLTRRKDNHGVRALLLGKDPEKTALVAAKISHYGRYSLLLFANGRNIVKTTGEPAASPLSINFGKESGS